MKLYSNLDPQYYENMHFSHNYDVNVNYDNSPTSFPIHWHTVGEIICASTDNSVFQVQGKEYRLNKNDILFIWPGELHATIHTDTDKYIIIQYYNNLLNQFSDMNQLRDKIFFRHYLASDSPNSPANKILEQMNYILNIYQDNVPLANIRMCLAVYNILLEFYDYCLLYDNTYPENTPSPRLQTIEVIANACCYISENCTRDLSLNEVAEYAGLSKFHFSRAFKECMQMTFCDYLSNQRIQQAIVLFENPEISIAEAAFQSGFGSIASFNRCFKKEMNCTPSEYRSMFMDPEKNYNESSYNVRSSINNI